jgi:hypothetical protein
MGGAVATFAIKAIAGAAIGAAASKALAKKPKADPAVAAAERRQEALLKSQEAANLRLKNEEDKREADLSGQVAGQRRAVAARRRGRGGLAFSGPKALKNTLGG